jgi:hypothetical protein
MADRFSVLTTPAHLTAHEDGSMIHTCTATRGTEVDALRAVETPNWQERQARRSYHEQIRDAINLSLNAFCHGCGDYHPLEEFDIDNRETTRHCRHIYCKAYRHQVRLVRTGRANLVPDTILMRIRKGSQRHSRTS